MSYEIKFVLKNTIKLWKNALVMQWENQKKKEKEKKCDKKKYKYIKRSLIMKWKNFNKIISK